MRASAHDADKTAFEESSGAKRSRSPESAEKLFLDIYSTLLAHVLMSHPQAVAVALWVAFAHLHDAVNVSPILRITSAERRCGKSTLLLMVQGFVPKPVQASSGTSAVIFRLIDQEHPTLLLDETEHWLPHNSAITAILNASHYRQTAFVPRCAGKKFKVRQYSTWCPKVVTGKGRLADTTEDRCVIVELRRKLPEDDVQPFRPDLDPLRPLRDRLAKWARANKKAIKTADPIVPRELNDRAADNWRPLFAIADLVSDDWAYHAREAALALTRTSKDDDSEGARLLKSVADAFDHYGCDCISSENLCKWLNQANSLYKSYGSRDLNSHSLARLLKPFDIVPRNVRWKDNDGYGKPCDRQAKGYRSQQFDEAWHRYLPEMFEDEDRPQSESAREDDDSRAALGDDAASASSVDDIKTH